MISLIRIIDPVFCTPFFQSLYPSYIYRTLASASEEKFTIDKVIIKPILIEIFSNCEKNQSINTNVDSGINILDPSPCIKMLRERSTHCDYLLFTFFGCSTNSGSRGASAPTGRDSGSVFWVKKRQRTLLLIISQASIHEKRHSCCFLND